MFEILIDAISNNRASRLDAAVFRIWGQNRKQFSFIRPLVNLASVHTKNNNSTTNYMYTFMYIYVYEWCSRIILTCKFFAPWKPQKLYCSGPESTIQVRQDLSKRFTAIFTDANVEKVARFSCTFETFQVKITGVKKNPKFRVIFDREIRRN